jgi:hypothetical protein
MAEGCLSNLSKTDETLNGLTYSNMLNCNGYELNHSKQFQNFARSLLLRVQEDGDERGTSLKMRKHQEIVKQYMVKSSEFAENTARVGAISPYRGLLLFHDMGTGKTLTGIHIGVNFILEYRLPLLKRCREEARLRGETFDPISETAGKVFLMFYQRLKPNWYGRNGDGEIKRYLKGYFDLKAYFIEHFDIEKYQGLFPKEYRPNQVWKEFGESAPPGTDVGTPEYFKFIKELVYDMIEQEGDDPEGDGDDPEGDGDDPEGDGGDPEGDGGDPEGDGGDPEGDDPEGDDPEGDDVVLGGGHRNRYEMRNRYSSYKFSDREQIGGVDDDDEWAADLEDGNTAENFDDGDGEEDYDDGDGDDWAGDIDGDGDDWAGDIDDHGSGTMDMEELQNLIVKTFVEEHIKFLNCDPTAAFPVTLSKPENRPNHNMIIIDEAHNVVSYIYGAINPTKMGTQSRVGKTMYEWLLSARDSKIVFLSGTPIINRPEELLVMMNILKGRMMDGNGEEHTLFKLESEIVEKYIYDQDYQVINPLLMLRRLAGLVSRKIREESEHNPYPYWKRDRDLIIERCNELLEGPDAPNSDSPQFEELTDLRQKAKTLLDRTELSKIVTELGLESRDVKDPKVEELFDLSIGTVKKVLVPLSSSHLEVYLKAKASEARSYAKRKWGTDEEEKSHKNSHELCTFPLDKSLNYRLRPEKIGDKYDSSPEKREDHDHRTEKSRTRTRRGDVEKENRRRMYRGLVEASDDDLDRMKIFRYDTSRITEDAPKMAKMFETILDRANNDLHFVYSRSIIYGAFHFEGYLQAYGYMPYLFDKSSATTEAEIQTKINQELDRLENIINDEKNPIKGFYVKYTEPYYLIVDGAKINHPQKISNEVRIDTIRNIFNHPRNKEGKIVRLLIGTDKAKEGLDLKHVRQVYVMEPWWNMVKPEQAMGRAVRYLSHYRPPRMSPDGTPKDDGEGFQRLDDRYVKINMLVATIRYDDLEPEQQAKLRSREVLTTDEYVFKRAIDKLHINQSIQELLNRSSIDCGLYPENENMSCAHYFNPTELGHAYQLILENDLADEAFLEYHQLSQTTFQIIKIGDNEYLKRQFYADNDQSEKVKIHYNYQGQSYSKDPKAILYQPFCKQNFVIPALAYVPHGSMVLEIHYPHFQIIPAV